MVISDWLFCSTLDFDYVSRQALTSTEASLNLLTLWLACIFMLIFLRMNLVKFMDRCSTKILTICPILVVSKITSKVKRMVSLSNEIFNQKTIIYNTLRTHSASLSLPTEPSAWNLLNTFFSLSTSSFFAIIMLYFHFQVVLWVSHFHWLYNGVKWLYNTILSFSVV